MVILKWITILRTLSKHWSTRICVYAWIITSARGFFKYTDSNVNFACISTTCTRNRGSSSNVKRRTFVGESRVEFDWKRLKYISIRPWHRFPPIIITTNTVARLDDSKHFYRVLFFSTTNMVLGSGLLRGPVFMQIHLLIFYFLIIPTPTIYT